VDYVAEYSFNAELAEDTGAVIGAGSAWLCNKANRWLQRKK
jgi:hypothetical protein